MFPILGPCAETSRGLLKTRPKTRLGGAVSVDVFIKIPHFARVLKKFPNLRQKNFLTKYLGSIFGGLRSAPFQEVQKARQGPKKEVFWGPLPRKFENVPKQVSHFWGVFHVLRFSRYFACFKMMKIFWKK